MVVVNRQMELPAVPRKRVRLGDAVNSSGEPMTLGEEVAVDLRLTSDVTAFYAAHPEQAARALEVNIEGLIGYTPWESAKPPPCAGWWDVTDHVMGMDCGRMWFSGGAAWTSGPDVASGLGLTHEAFRKTFAWRGLREQHPAGYPVPPYYNFPGRSLPAGMVFVRQRVRL